MDKKIIVTTSWDDGHILDMKLAGLLRKYSIRATFYIAPTNREITKKDLLTDADIKLLSDDFEIGSHTMTHPRLTAINEREADKEIVVSKKYLEHVIKKEITMFCYPGGKYNNKIKECVKKAGYIGARTTEQMITAKPNDLFEIGTTIQDFPLSLRGVCGEAKYAAKNNVRLLPALFTREWSDVAIDTFNFVREHGGIWHLWGHSWMVDTYDDWVNLEKVLRYVGGKDEIKYLTNSEAYIDKRIK